MRLWSSTLLALLIVSCEKPSHDEFYYVPPVVLPVERSTDETSKPSPTPTATGVIAMQEDRWKAARIRKEKVHQSRVIADKISDGKSRYAEVGLRASVPWEVIGAIHNMECGLSWRTNLANGDPLSNRTRHVPKGRPVSGAPPFTWEDAAVDALIFDQLDKKDWGRIGARLQNVEAYNGLGHQKYHADVPTPYLWAGTSLYTRGKYVADGKWSPTAISEQIGVATIWKVDDMQPAEDE